MRRVWTILIAVAVLGLALAVYLAIVLRPQTHPAPPTAGAPRPFSHVFVIVMENQSADTLLANPRASYIRSLARQYAYDSAYYGVTHPSLPNYVALIAGRTFGSHSDSPAQRFSGPTLASELNQAGISWQAVMESLPHTGFAGAWSPGASEEAPTLYAEKHDPFMLFRNLRAHDRQHVVPLSVLAAELTSGAVPRFVFLTPNLCNDMHGQAGGRHPACPESQKSRLIRDGNSFLAAWIPRILHSPAWHGNAVVFVVWDEGGGAPTLQPGALRAYMAPGPEAPLLLAGLPVLGRLGGGNVPLIVIARDGPRHKRIALWADHYSILKTIEAAWHLPYLGHAGSPSVPLLTPLIERAS